MDLTDRLTRVLLGTLTLTAVLLPATVAAADLPDEKAPPPPTDEPEPDPECPEGGPVTAECPLIVCFIDDPDCPPPDEEEPECPGDEDCPVLCVEDDPDCPAPGEDKDPDPEDEPDDEPVPADPNFTG